MKVNFKTIAFGGLAVGGLLWFLRSFTAGIKYEFKGLRWLGLNGTKLRFALIYDLVNDNDIPATVSRFEGKLKYGDYKLSDVTIGEDKAVEIGPGQTEPMEVKFSVSPGTLLAEILRFVDEKSGLKRFNLSGWMAGKIGQVPFKVYFKENLALAE